MVTLMSEKRKWFDPRTTTYQLPGPILNVSRVTSAEGEELVATLQVLCTRGKSGRACLRLFLGRAALSPAARLAVNLSVLLQQMKIQEIQSVLQHGLTTAERQALLCLERYRVTPRLKRIAQGLLNVDERYRLSAALGKLFREERSRF